ncbi:MAG: type II secretion system F family protein [Betaproteobacteria bacterium]|nr:type II secretion system F family protein [Betaproteobacteria bacterium]
MQFHVHALDGRQQVVSLTLEAVSEAAALELARVRGLKVFAVRGKTPSLRLAVRKNAKFPTTLFSVELASLLEAGLNLVEALSTLSEKTPDSQSHEVLSRILGAIQRGEPFSQALAAYPQYFSPLYVATIKAAERTGNVREALGRYIAYQEELDKVRKKIVSATIYPAILAVVGALVLGFLMFYVVPRFATVYEDMSGTLPFFSRVLLGFGGFVGKNAWAIGVTFAALASSAVFLATKPEVHSWINRRVWAIPAIGERLKVYQLARLYRTAGMLLKAGIPALQALEMVRDLLSAHLRPQLERARHMIEQGRAMSAALAEAGLATPVASRMMTVGERSGDMGGMFAQIARFHDDEVARFIDWFTRAFEPLLMTVLGVSVGLVVVLMYMPIFELAGSIH